MNNRLLIGFLFGLNLIFTLAETSAQFKEKVIINLCVTAAESETILPMIELYMEGFYGRAFEVNTLSSVSDGVEYSIEETQKCVNDFVHYKSAINDAHSRELSCLVYFEYEESPSMVMKKTLTSNGTFPIAIPRNLTEIELMDYIGTRIRELIYYTSNPLACPNPPRDFQVEDFNSCRNTKLFDTCEARCSKHLKTKTETILMFCDLYSRWKTIGTCEAFCVDPPNIENSMSVPSCFRRNLDDKCVFQCAPYHLKTGSDYTCGKVNETDYGWLGNGSCVFHYNCKINFFTCVKRTGTWNQYFKYIEDGLRYVYVKSEFIDARESLMNDLWSNDLENEIKCLSNLINMKNSTLQHGVNVVIFNKKIGQPYETDLIKNGFIPYQDFGNNNYRINFEEYAQEYCYYKTNPLYCQTVPVIENADVASLQSCVGTLLLGTCEVKCKKGFSIKFKYLFCDYRGKWDNEYKSSWNANSRQCRRDRPPSNVERSCGRVSRSCSLAFYICVEGNEENDLIVNNIVNRFKELPNAQNNFEFFNITQHSDISSRLNDCVTEANKKPSGKHRVMLYRAKNPRSNTTEDDRFMAQSGFFPFEISKNFSNYNFRKSLSDMCYRPMLCPKAPVIFNAEPESLEKCKGTALHHSCYFQCKEGFKSSFPQVDCLYNGVWDTTETEPCYKNRCDFAPLVENAVSVKHCIGKEVYQTCIVECKPGYYKYGIDFVCRMDPSNFQLLSWAGNANCYKELGDTAE